MSAVRSAVLSAGAAVAGSAVFARVVALLERLYRGRSGLLTVLTYHRVDDPGAEPALYPGLISATPHDFEEQMRFLAANYRVISLAQLLETRETGRRLPPRSVMVTFDDAYRDFGEHAWPTLRRLGLPVTLFVPTAFPDHPERGFWWDQLYHAVTESSRPEVAAFGQRLPLADARTRSNAFRALVRAVKARPHHEAMSEVERIISELGARETRHAVLGWHELRQLAAEGVTLAPHSRTHPRLDRLPAAELSAELRGSFEDLQRKLGGAPRVIAYPDGGHDAAVVAEAAAAGFVAAFTTERGANDLARADWLRLRRINVGRRSPLTLIRAQLLALSSIRIRPSPAWSHP